MFGETETMINVVESITVKPRNDSMMRPWGYAGFAPHATFICWLVLVILYVVMTRPRTGSLTTAILGTPPLN